MFIFVIIGLAYLPLQIAAWKKWTGPWFYWSFAPAVIPISGCAFGLVKNSNLWPFWGVFLFPYSLLTLGLLWFCRFFMARRKNLTRSH